MTLPPSPDSDYGFSGRVPRGHGRSVRHRTGSACAARKRRASPLRCAVRPGVRGRSRWRGQAARRHLRTAARHARARECRSTTSMKSSGGCRGSAPEIASRNALAVTASFGSAISRTAIRIVSPCRANAFRNSSRTHFRPAVLVLRRHAATRVASGAVDRAGRSDDLVLAGPVGRLALSR